MRPVSHTHKKLMIARLKLIAHLPEAERDEELKAMTQISSTEVLVVLGIHATIVIIGVVSYLWSAQP